MKWFTHPHPQLPLTCLGLSLLVSGCATTPAPHALAPYQNLRDQAVVSNVIPAEFSAAEAASLLELCIELNNQDDRNNPKLKDPEGQFQAKPDGWRLVYDSRHPGNTDWNKVWSWNGEGDNPNDIKTNGLKPLNNAWIMAESKQDPGHIAIAIRGTVAEWTSILADAYASTIPAFGGVELPKNRSLPIAFAATPSAEVHLGFAYAAFSLLFDQQRGILEQLQQRLATQPINRITVTGHSQGAAVATLIHAFLYYATVDPQNPYQLPLKSKPILKSYLFAQPKPGNLQFAQDFARIAGSTAFVVNNDRDPVPQVPLSLETVSEVTRFVTEDNVSVGGILNHVSDFFGDAKEAVRGSIAELFTGHVADDFENTGVKASVAKYFGNAPANNPEIHAKSLNYTLAGQLIPVFGVKEGGDCYTIGKQPDILLQHHATSYRKLINAQLLRRDSRCGNPNNP
ncbi:lipase family protein [Methylomonas sp. OY6]|uniref:Lipase family protein n=1 Tax=Methylomonas defluvii TaxID=3045149 RepID=A0ABU4UCR3_9GAMM|nr:lipase family protein [Methylomonas sp. OY6]MDX8126732.1 lipase family protein [Methylomonas sp. OY6]